MEWVFVKMVLSLAAVLGLMFLITFLLKRTVLQGNARGRSRVDIEILGQRTLQPKRSMVVVKVLNRVLVVGVTEQGMRTLTEIPEAELPQDAAAQADVAPLAADHHPSVWTQKGWSSMFASHLMHALGRR